MNTSTNVYSPVMPSMEPSSRTSASRYVGFDPCNSYANPDSTVAVARPSATQLCQTHLGLRLGKGHTIV